MIMLIVLLAIAFVVAAAFTQTRGRSHAGTLRTQVRPVLFRHPIRPVLPAGLQAMIQDGVLEATFDNALRPDFLFPAAATVDPVAGQVGQRITRTRTGLLAPTTTAITGSDPSAQNYAIEQYSGVLDQFGNSTDTNMLGSATSQASKFVRDIQTLGINAGQSLNQLARNRLYGVYAGGRTWCRTADGASNTTIDVQSVDGFEFVLVNGVPTAVSASTPLNVTINGVANTVTGVDRANRRLTLGTARVDVQGDPVVASNAPVSIRPNARNTGFNITTGDTATVGLFFDAVARLRAMNVPTFADGTYQAHVDSVTMRQLLSDTEFRQAFQSQGPSDTYSQGRLTIFGGVTFVLNIEVPTVTGDGQANTVRRPIVLGAEPIIAMPLEGQGQLLTGTGVEDVPGISLIEVAPQMEVALIVRPPQDRLQQVISSSWAWTGDFAIPTDSTTGDTAIAKRAVVIEHLG
jgi:N4-gp56 family major capsid protein